MYIFEKGLSPDDTKTIVPLYFEVTADTEEIFITADYEPRVEEDEEKNRRLIMPAFKEYISGRGEGPDRGVLSAYESFALEEFSPVRNLLDYTVIDPQGRVRARAGGHFFDPLQITEDFASLGCVRGGMIPGEWRLILEVHAQYLNRLERLPAVRPPGNHPGYGTLDFFRAHGAGRLSRGQ